MDDSNIYEYDWSNTGNMIVKMGMGFRDSSSLKTYNWFDYYLASTVYKQTWKPALGAADVAKLNSIAKVHF